MSNPAVIILDDASNAKGRFKRFTIEDNIGESIHLHIDSLRIDFTIKEYFEFSRLIKEALRELNLFKEYSLDDFDVYFLKKCSSFLLELESINIEEVKLSELQCIQYNKDTKFLVPVNETLAYRYLKDDSSDFLNYQQFNYWGVSNKSRLDSLSKSIEANSYPFNNQHIIVFNNQNIIRDGQHRAAALAFQKGIGQTIKIMRFIFKNDSNSLSFNQNILFKYNTQKQLQFSRQFSNVFQDICKINGKCVIYGNGSFGQTLCALLSGKIVAIVDKKSKNTQIKPQAEDVYNPVVLEFLSFDYIIISVLGREEEIVQYLIKELNIDKNKIILLNTV